ncbi:hypothetical protein COO60DRAFT_270679 [Scenedesmus sp. NREL 46B-D3]|nr:hypothetical protein COO60DRAFT_270679 [Scenedesmus sp. NREL 46B-D3]
MLHMHAPLVLPLISGTYAISQAGCGCGPLHGLSSMPHARRQPAEPALQLEQSCGMHISMYCATLKHPGWATTAAACLCTLTCRLLQQHCRRLITPASLFFVVTRVLAQWVLREDMSCTWHVV